MTTSIEEAFILLIIFQLKHFVCDFPLQREYMLRKTLPGWEFLAPLSLHCFVHAMFTLIIVIFYNASLIWLAPVDFISHFIMDRIKSGPRYLGRYNDLNNPGFWNSLGFDQMIHCFTNFYIVWALIHA